MSQHKALENLKRAFNRNNLTLYLGAGVSVSNGMPTWERLVLAMYFSAISEQHIDGWRPFSNYLFAIAEWQLASSREPLEITARKLQKYFCGSDTFEADRFLNSLYRTLYGGFLNASGEPEPGVDSGALRDANKTLDAVARLCESGKPGSSGIREVVTYNYDDLLETVLVNCPHQPIFRTMPVEQDKLPVYHVHGFVPLSRNRQGSAGEEIIFTEDQYHRVAQSPYHWSSLIQLQSLASSTVLMIGLSLSDRNIRRLLDALGNAPIDTNIYALFKKPAQDPVGDKVLDTIHHNAVQYLEKFARSGVNSEQNTESGIFLSNPGVKSSAPAIKSSVEGVKGPRYRLEIAAIIEAVEQLNLEQQDYVMRKLGVTPIWFEDYDDIPGILDSIID